MYQLYYYPGNANLAPHMLLEEIGVPYELILVDRDKNAQRSPQYLKLNPNGRIPTLVDGDLVLFEAAAICLHLADRHPEAALAPALGTPARAEFYKWLIYLTNTLQAELLIYFYPERLAIDANAAAAVKLRAQERVADMLDLIEQALAQRAAAGHQVADEGPVPDVGLGDETRRVQRVDREDVDPGDVVGDDQQRARMHRAARLDADAQSAQHARRPAPHVGHALRRRDEGEPQRADQRAAHGLPERGREPPESAREPHPRWAS
mgnify:CR=1 FL=1